ncbi:hypothetical protein, partial [Acidianus sp. RZ1]|uniref:hypothetical protein n=1 Tax=Acidianus sp. RZ1 TaxID=1540082 RepID=UPI001C0F55F4
ETKSFKVKFNKGSMLAMVMTTVYVLPYSIISTYLPVYMTEKGVSLSYSYSIFIPFFMFMTLTRFILSYYHSLGERIDSLFSISVLLTIRWDTTSVSFNKLRGDIYFTYPPECTSWNFIPISLISCFKIFK